MNKGTIMSQCLRPHHALCIILFAEEGHSVPYASAMKRYIKALTEKPDTEIVLFAVPDEICGFCPHNIDSNCEKSNEVDISDSKILSCCGMTFGEKTTWNYLSHRLINSVILKNLLSDVCEGCKFISRCEKTAAHLFGKI